MKRIFVFVLLALTLECTLGDSIAKKTTCSGRPAYICDVVLPNFCENSNSCPADPVFVFPGYAGSYGFENFNAISFDSFYAPSGDVEGRVAVRNSMNVNAFSVGYNVNYLVDIPLPYALVIGSDGTYNYGSVSPNTERIFAGVSFVSQTYLTDRTDIPGSPILNSQFDDAQAFYTQLSNEFAAVTPNAVVYYQFGALGLTCNDILADSYTVSVDASDFSIINAYTLFINCNPLAQYIFNIGGTGDVIFTGNGIPIPRNKVLFNILGSGRLITVKSAVYGSILGPNQQYYQDQGDVYGHVYVGNIQRVHEINQGSCTIKTPQPAQNCSSTSSSPLTTRALTTSALTTSRLTTQPLTTQPLTTQPLTTQPLTTQPLTTQQLTTQPLTTQQLTTQPLTTQALTTKDITTQPLTTQPLTTQQLTTQPLTTQALTTQPLTTQPLTTGDITTQPLTTQIFTTNGLTTRALTTRRAPSK